MTEQHRTETIDLDRHGVRESGQQRHVVLAKLSCGPRGDLIGDVNLLTPRQGHEFAVRIATNEEAVQDGGGLRARRVITGDHDEIGRADLWFGQYGLQHR